MAVSCAPTNLWKSFSAQLAWRHHSLRWLSSVVGQEVMTSSGIVRLGQMSRVDPAGCPGHIQPCYIIMQGQDHWLCHVHQGAHGTDIHPAKVQELSRAQRW